MKILKNKKIMFIMIAIIILITISITTFASSIYFNWGQELKSGLARRDNSYVVLVNDKPIYKKNYENYINNLKYAAGKFTDKEVLDKMIRLEVLLQECEKLNLTVTDEEADTFTDESFDLLYAEGNEEQLNIFEEFTKGLGVSMEEYKEMSKYTYKNTLLVGKYQDYLIEQYKSLNITDIHFEEYYKNIVTDLIKEAVIVENLE